MPNASATSTEDFFNLGDGTAGTLAGNFEGDFTLECWVRLNDVNQATLIDILGQIMKI